MEKSMEGLEVADADLTVYIHPSRANKVRHAVLRQLSSLLFTYDEMFDGVILAYEVNFRSRIAKILPGLVPHFGVKLKATLLLFSPRPDMLLEGKVVKLGKESIHVIVLGFCSAVIMLEDIREEFKYMIKDGVGVFSSKSHKRHRIKVGSMLRFSVKSVDEEILHISGSLIPSHTGCIRWLYKHGVETLSDHYNKLEEKPKHGLEAPPVRSAQSKESLKDVVGDQLTDRGLKRHRERNIEKEVQNQVSGLSNETDQSFDQSRSHKSRKKTARE